LFNRLLEHLPWRRAELLPLFLLASLVGLAEYVRTGIFTAYLPQLHGKDLGLGVVGLAATLQYLADTLLRSPAGHLSERYGAARLLPPAALLAFLSALLIIFAGNPFLILAAALLNGAAVSAFWPTLMTFSSRAANDNEDGRAIGFTFTLVAPFIGAGVLLTGYLYGVSARLAAASLTFVLVLLVVLALAGALLFFARNVAPQQRTGNFPWRLLVLLAPGALMQMLALGLLTPILYPYLDQLGFSTRDLILAMVAGGVAEFSLISPFGKLVDKSEPFRIFVLALSLAGGALFAFSQIASLLGLVLMAVFAGAVQAILIPAWGGLISRTLPDEYKASSWGALMTFEGLGFALGPVIGGYSWQLIGHKAPFLVGAALYLLVAAFYLIRLIKGSSRG